MHLTIEMNRYFHMYSIIEQFRVTALKKLKIQIFLIQKYRPILKLFTRHFAYFIGSEKLDDHLK